MTATAAPTATTLVLSGEQVRSLLTLDEAMAVQRRAFVAQAAGDVTASPNAWLRLPDQERRRGWLKILAGHERSSGALGVKVLARFADRPSGQNLGSLVVLFDDEDGTVLAIMDGVHITAVRTGAGAGLAAEALAAPGARVLGVVGTGVVAWHSIRATLAVRPTIGQVRVFSRSAQRRAELAARVRDELGVAALAVDGVAAATAGADVVLTATNAPGPVLLAEHLAPGQLVLAMGIRHEVAPEAVARCRVVPDGAAEAIEDGKFSVALAAGLADEADLGPELGTVLSTPGPWHDRSGVTLFDSSGVAVQDVTLAQHVLTKARAAGLGSLVDVGAGAEPA